MQTWWTNHKTKQKLKMKSLLDESDSMFCTYCKGSTFEPKFIFSVTSPLLYHNTKRKQFDQQVATCQTVCVCGSRQVFG